MSKQKESEILPRYPETNKYHLDKPSKIYELFFHILQQLELNTPKYPKHIGIIMDGNGRWAKEKNRPRIFGHKNGIRAVRETVETCAEIGIEVLTLYSFSTENWGRPQEEVKFLMKLFETYLKSELSNLKKNNIQLRLLGNMKKLPNFVYDPLEDALKQTTNNTGMTLALAVDYGSRNEITQVVKSLSQKVLKGELSTDDIDENVISQELYTKDLPNPDLIIRTSGVYRVSNFLLWQAAYAEYYFTELYWPDFNKSELLKALQDYSGRKRRYGKI